MGLVPLDLLLHRGLMFRFHRGQQEVFHGFRHFAPDDDRSPLGCRPDLHLPSQFGRNRQGGRSGQGRHKIGQQGFTGSLSGRFGIAEQVGADRRLYRLGGLVGVETHVVDHAVGQPLGRFGKAGGDDMRVGAVQFRVLPASGIGHPQHPAQKLFHVLRGTAFL